MSADYLLIVPLFLAVGAGWWLGRSQNRSAQLEQERKVNLSREYFIGLDYLISEKNR